MFSDPFEHFESIPTLQLHMNLNFDVFILNWWSLLFIFVFFFPFRSYFITFLWKYFNSCPSADLTRSQNQLTFTLLVYMKSTFVRRGTSPRRRNTKSLLEVFLCTKTSRFIPKFKRKKNHDFFPNLNMVDLPAQHPQNFYSGIPKLHVKKKKKRKHLLLLLFPQD